MLKNIPQKQQVFAYDFLLNSQLLPQPSKTNLNQLIEFNQQEIPNQQNQNLQLCSTLKPTKMSAFSLCKQKTGQMPSIQTSIKRLQGQSKQKYINLKPDMLLGSKGSQAREGTYEGCLFATREMSLGKCQELNLMGIKIQEDQEQKYVQRKLLSWENQQVDPNAAGQQSQSMSSQKFSPYTSTNINNFEQKKRRKPSTEAKGKNFKNFLILIKRFIKKHLQNRITHLNTPNPSQSPQPNPSPSPSPSSLQSFLTTFFQQTYRTNLHQFNKLFNSEHPELRALLADMFLSRRLGREVQLSRINAKNRSMFIKKINLLRKGLIYGKLVSL